MNLLLAHGAEAGTDAGIWEGLPLLPAAVMGYVEEVTEVLHDGAEVNARDREVTCNQKLP